VRIYFCSDIHGSRKCWKKFLATAKHYDADIIIIGGDITGKFVVPIVEAPGGQRKARFLGVERRVRTGDELRRLKDLIADAGQYAFETTPEQQAWYAADQTRIDELFKRLAVERAEEWVTEADEKLSAASVRIFVSGANDDFLEVDDVLKKSKVIEDPNGRVIDLDGGLQIMGMGWGNITPWSCPRDISEKELAQRIDAAASGVRDPARCIFSLHVPPYGTDLDLAPELDANLRPILEAGGVKMVPVGSTATRQAIEKYRPLLGLHGHIHESRGVKRLASVPIANPGSEYGEGVLDGVIIDVDRARIRDIQLVSG
jgi:uncharacterized protein